MLAARVQITGEPGTVVPDGMRLRAYGAGLFVCWPTWRRVLASWGLRWFALRIGRRGSVTVIVRSTPR